VTPDTVHLLAQIIRHQRALVTSFEGWVRKQPRSDTCRELVQLIAAARFVIDGYEKQLSQYDVDQPVSK
jgi:hypothetical protein